MYKTNQLHEKQGGSLNTSATVVIKLVYQHGETGESPKLSEDIKNSMKNSKLGDTFEIAGKNWEVIGVISDGGLFHEHRQITLREADNIAVA